MENNQILDTSSLIHKKFGTTTIFSVLEYPAALRNNIKIVWPEKNDYLKALAIVQGLFKIGRPIPIIDVLNAAIAINRDFKLITRDNHFTHIKKVERNFKLQIDE